ncbi:hypothetical protein GRX01_05025 [Halobaculum sp. WSA2]|uniref:DUF4129 domain-containing protein n=1 Tax=Halobaculum saliterrae TaxID=2073113 RepID=A0A6B0SP54_9EURY|nr:hypothetical protein [Halobaculum saliterrae]MXR40708.1 hypothetical protein [Halobaculum saliterrae]
MNRAAVVRAIAACLLLASAASAVGAAPVVSGSGATQADLTDAPVAQVADDGTRNNSTVRHEDPESVDGDGDTAAISSHLVGQLAGNLNGSLTSLNQEEYERAKELLGSGYDDDLEKYVDVQGDIDGGDGDDGGGFESAQRTQQTYVEQVQSFRQTREEYREAVENGNRERARRLARNLTETADRIETTQRELLAAYSRIENTTGVNLAGEREMIQETTANVSETAAELETAELTRTRLSLSVADPRASFLDPLTISGTLRTANGTPVANRSIEVRVGQRTLTATTDESGALTLRYRPTLLRANATEVRVVYRPENASVYLPSNGTVPIDVQQVEATATLTAPAEASFGDRVAVNGSVTADGVAVDGIPLRLRVGNATLGTGTTGEDGAYSLAGTLPAEVDDGQQRVVVAPASDDRAVVVTAVESALAVEPTTTRLAANASLESADTVAVRGRLTTSDGTPVAGESVDVRLGDRVVASVTTGPDGRYAETVAVPAALSDAETATLVASYAAPETNLEPARARTTVSLVAPDGEADDPAGNTDGLGILGPGVSGVLTPVLAAVPLPAEQIGLLVAGLLVVLAGVGAYGLATREDSDPTAPAESTAATAGADADAPAAAAAAESTPAPLDDARAHLAEDPTVATQVAFATVRDALAERHGVDDALTHREIARAYREATDADAAADALDHLTDVYERAAFGPAGVSQADAEGAIEDARTVLDA